jgi:ParB family chromosome partitioning protein
MLRDGRLSAGHARALITTDDPLGAGTTGGGPRAVGSGGGEARQVWAVEPEGRGGGKARAPEKDADTRALEADLSAALGMGVSIDHDQKARKR